jgi:hypothetical protein
MSDLVEHQRGAMRRFQTARLRFSRSRKRAPLMTEQLSFEQITRQRRAVDLHQWLGGSARARMDEARERFFSRPRLARNQHIGISGGNAFGHRSRFAHCS